MTGTADLAGDVDALAAELVAFRRDLHSHPELSWQEHRTTGCVVDRLHQAGLAPAVGPSGTGVVCDIGGAEDAAPFVVLRADIDALPLDDPKDVPYRSMVPGVCHACGHDVHTAVVLGAALALYAAGQRHGLPGRVRVLFQPAEESVPGGARPMQEAGLTKGAEAVLALHCTPYLEIGQVGLSAGPITSAADRIDVRLRGPGGHTARPHRTADLVHVAARVVLDLPMGLHRLTDSRDGINVTFGAIEAGHAANVIPTDARIQGSLRTLGRDTWERAPDLVAHLLRAIVEPLGASFHLDYQQGAPPVENDPALVTLVSAVAAEVLGEGVVQPTEQSAGGEDFSWFLCDAPGCYARLGVRSAGAPVIDIHAGAFDVDERCIPLGARLMAEAALAVLDGHGDLQVTGRGTRSG